MTESLIGSFSIWTILLVAVFILLAAVAIAGLYYYYRGTRAGKYISKPYKPSETENRAASVNCPACNWVNDGEAVYCMRCGRVLMSLDSAFEAAMTRCPECGCIARQSVSVCPECGHSLRNRSFPADHK